MSNLPERLRTEAGKTQRDISQDERAELFLEAARRIEALEAALRHVDKTLRDGKPEWIPMIVETALTYGVIK